MLHCVNFWLCTTLYLDCFYTSYIFISIPYIGKFQGKIFLLFSQNCLQPRKFNYTNIFQYIIILCNNSGNKKGNPVFQNQYGLSSSKS